MDETGTSPVLLQIKTDGSVYVIGAQVNLNYFLDGASYH